MFKNILLPVDLTDRHQPALNTAAELARQGGGEITLLHIVEIIPGLSLDEERVFYNRLEKMARAHLERLGEELTRQQVPWRLEVRFGHRAPEVAHYARDRGCDLVVLTSPRPDEENPAAGWASLSYKIGLLSPCPVLLVK
jgi:nucleotide-binding universal stress UspA family protein